MMPADILTIALRLGAQLKRCGAEYFGPCPRCGGRDRFSVNVRKQVFNCRGCGVGGNAIDLVRHLRDCTVGEAASLINREARGPPSRTVKEHDAAGAVRRIVAALQPILGSPGERYLRETRGIDVDAVSDMLASTHAIGWHRGLYFNQPDDERHGQHVAAIVAVMTDPVTAQPTGAITRTYIDGDLRKTTKAKTLGQGGGVARLSRDEDTLLGLHLAEGLESALSAAALGLRPIWSTGSATTLAKFPVLAGVEALTIICDHDANGTGERAARQLEARWLGWGREVVIYRPTMVGHDFNDCIRK
jgi:hypothetical protein